MEERNKWNLINWKTICKPKDKGGLGIRRIIDMNKALLTKMGWKLVENKTGWGRIMRAKYLANTHFRYNLFNNDLPNGSKVWNNILKNRSLLGKEVRLLVGNGKKIRF